MIDIKFIRENIEKVKANNKRRGCDADLEEIIRLDDRKKQLQTEVEGLRHERNAGAAGKPTDEERVHLRELRDKTQNLEKELMETGQKLTEKLSWLPNILANDVPRGIEPEVMKKWGEIPQFDFPIQDHVEIGKRLDLIDIERAVKVTGKRFYFLKNEAVLLEFALIQMALEYLIKKGFTPFITPELAKTRTLFGTGYLPWFKDDIYKVTTHGENDNEELSLIGTSEQMLVGYHADETIDEKKLPLKYAGFSSCFRTEDGSYGKDTRGILRVHQFNKVEQIIFCAPEDSEEWHLKCLENEEWFFQQLQIPYQVVKIPDGDFGAPGYKKYDLEAWLPGQNKYREMASNTNLTSFQTRRLGIRYRKKDTTLDYLHTISATGLAIGRTLIAILENYQQIDGSVKIPEVLQKYVGKTAILP